MKNKKAELSMETVIIAIVVLLVLVVIFTIFTTYMARSGKSFSDLFKKANEEDPQSLNVGDPQTLVVGANNPFTITGGETGTIKVSIGDNKVMTVIASDSSGTQINCNYGKAWTFKVGESKCCESSKSSLCITYKSLSTGDDNEDIPKINTFAKSEWPLPDDESPQKLCENAKSCVNYFDFWLSDGRINIRLDEVSSFLEGRHAHFHIYKFNEKGEAIEICQNNNYGGSNFAVESNSYENCIPASFTLGIVGFDQNAKYVLVSVKKTEITLGSGSNLNGGNDLSGSGPSVKKSVE